MTNERVVWKNPDAVTMPWLLRDAATKWPDKVYLDFAGEKYTYSQVDRESSRLANGLAAIGVAPGNTVCSFLDTSIDAVLVWFAVAKLGAVIVPINTAFRGEFLRHQVADSSAQIVIMDSHYADRLNAIEDGAPDVRALIHRGPRPEFATRLQLLSLNSLAADNDIAPDVEIKPGDLGALIYTSGTTGPSKGCMLSQNMLSRMIISDLSLTGDDVLWMSVPLFHLGGIGAFMGTLRLGMTLSICPRFSATRFWEEIERSQATAFFSMASAAFPLLVDAPDNPIQQRYHGRLRVVFGAPFADDVQEKWKQRFGVQHAFQYGYGQTETCKVASHPGAGQVCPPGTSGRIVDCYDARIVDDNGEEVPAGTAGELILRPKIPHVMFDGYWKRPLETALAWRGLWFHTGDVARIDENDFFFFVDRKKDYIRYRGENISSYEMEIALRAHPHIEDVAVHAVRSQFAEDDVKITVVMREGHTESEEGLCRWTMERLPFFAVPRYIEFRKELPRNAVGRVLKFELRAEGVTATTWDREAAGIKVVR